MAPNHCFSLLNTDQAAIQEETSHDHFRKPTTVKSSLQTGLQTFLYAPYSHDILLYYVEPYFYLHLSHSYAQIPSPSSHQLFHVRLGADLHHG